MGRKQLNHVQYKRNIHPDFVSTMDKTLNKLKEDELRSVAHKSVVEYVEHSIGNNNVSNDIKTYKDKITRKLIELQSSDDTECAHHDADDLLLKLLSLLGYDDVVQEFNKIRKWYA